MREKPENRDVTRREFLRGIGATGTTLALSTIANLAFPSRAEAVKVREDMTWEKGLAALKWDVFNADNETMAIYVESAQSGWRRPRDLGIIQGSKEDMLSDERLFRQLIATEKEFLAMRRAHTHTITTLIHTGHVPPNIKESLAHGESAPPLAPPSLSDVLLHIWTNKRIFGNSGVQCEDIALDPTGVWRLSLSKTGTFSDTMFEYMLLIQEKIPAAIKQTDLSESDKETLDTCIKKLDTSCVEKFNVPKVKQLFARYYGIEASSGFWFGPADAYQNTVLTLQQHSVSLSDAERQKLIDKIVNLAKEIDIALTFSPYDKKTEG